MYSILYVVEKAYFEHPKYGAFEIQLNAFVHFYIPKKPNVII